MRKSNKNRKRGEESGERSLKTLISVPVYKKL
jgi:hypothetical protein